MLSPCPTGWKSPSEESVELIDLAARFGDERLPLGLGLDDAPLAKRNQS